MSETLIGREDADSPYAFVAPADRSDDTQQAREAAMLLLASDYVDEHPDAESALAWARKVEHSLLREPWAEGKHSGDCTKTAYTCSRCMVEDYEKATAHFAEFSVPQALAALLAERDRYEQRERNLRWLLAGWKAKGPLDPAGELEAALAGESE
jgi:hypothetical protein